MTGSKVTVQLITFHFSGLRMWHIVLFYTCQCSWLIIDLTWAVTSTLVTASMFTSTILNLCISLSENLKPGVFLPLLTNKTTVKITSNIYTYQSHSQIYNISFSLFNIKIQNYKHKRKHTRLINSFQ